MVVRSVNIDPTAETCLILLSRVGDSGRGEKRVFRCKTCLKEFFSFQALGGHRASHKKLINSDDPSLPGSPKKKPKTTTVHPCPICGLDFPMGQALGGHMRKHRNERVSGALVTRSLFPEATTVTNLTKSGSEMRVACLKLNVNSVESMLNTKLELGRTMY